MSIIALSHNEGSAYYLHEVFGKFYFHLGEGLHGNYLGQSELATPCSWLDPHGVGILLTNEGLDDIFEDEELNPEPELDPITYALGVRVMQDYGANWNPRGHYFEDQIQAEKAMSRLEALETLPEWGKLAAIHGWTVPQRRSPCGPDDNEEERIEAIKRTINEVAMLSDRLNLKHPGGTLEYQNTNPIDETQLSGRARLRLLKGFKPKN